MLSERHCVVVQCSGALTIGRAETMRDTLLAALKEGGDIDVDCTAATEVDFSFVQLLLAARSSAARRGGVLRVKGGSEVLRTLLHSGGLAGDDEFWTGGN